MKLPVGLSDFKQLIEGGYQFADKSPFIKEIIDDSSSVIVITRPRRFGKTLNLSMLHYFLQANYPQEQNLFKGLAISENKEFCKTHQNQYPVIFVSFKDIKQPTYDEAYGDIVELMRALYSEHIYLLEGNTLQEGEKAIFTALLNKQADLSDIKSAIMQLSEYMSRKFNKYPIILIDEYDTPIQEAFLRGYYKEMVDLMRSVFGKALKDNQYLFKGIVTGITRISQESLFSGLNNLEVYSLLREEYGQYFGLTEPEVAKLITESGQKVSLDGIKEWYNGYRVGQYTLYNPWSIISCLKNRGKLQPYWINTSNNDLIAKLLKSAKPIVKQQFEELLQGNIIEQPLSENLVFTEIETDEAALWSLLLYAGYLKVLFSEFRGYRLMAKIAIPNREVGFVYDKIVEKWFIETASLDSYDKFVQSLSSGEIDKFKAYLSTYIMQSGSYFDFNSNTPEQIFHVFILGLVVGLRDRYIIHSNQESGLGRFDVIFIPKDKKAKGILLEFKSSTSADLLLDKAKEALAQIKNKHYMEVFKQHSVTSALAIGLSFYSKQMELVHETINI